MRYLLSVISLVLAVACFALAIGQRTIWAPPQTITEQLQQAVDSPVVVLGGDVLATHEGRQTITITGDGAITAVVGRTSDVLGWIGEADHAVVVDQDGELGLDVTNGGEESVPAIAGSDLWVQEATGEGEVSLELAAPLDYSVAIVSDGTAAAPSDIRVEWPNERSMPFFGPLMTAGFVLAALALLLLLLAVRRHRRHRGPQRRLSPAPSRRERREIQRGAKRGLPVAPPQQAIEAGSAPDPDDAASGETATDASTTGETPATDAPETPADDARRTERRATPRRRATLRRVRLVVPIAMGAALLTGCGPQYWPDLAQPSATPSGSPEPTSLEDTLPPAAVTVRQFERILADTREVVAQADSTLDANLAAERLGGPQLDARTVNYTVRGQDGSIAAATGIPDGDIQLLLPQQSEVWPRSVMAVVGWQDETQAQSALVFVQDSPREDYRLVYQFRLESGNQLTGASADVGAPGLPANTPLLEVAPESIAAAYGDVLISGPNSSWAPRFPAENDSLQEQVGYDDKQETLALETSQTVDMTFADAEDDQAPVTLVADADGGAYVATSFVESTTSIPREEGVTVRPGVGAQTALSPVESSTTGLTASYQIQALFYVPPKSDDGSEQPLVLLGYAYALIDVQEVQG
ncbi:hypothetical protein [Agrococcus jejuensis]|uniref:DUF8094 domain-containing protein n=1 Tax=Agrococcus jejuensis TaxID=399736 RepID=A0A1G8GK54_9MICO|nr:hypothetical protein [Agrococcus jejuensis]SDH94697.1 hypothetical protein SAMN04489720_2968 [Agrococcus jejuensis]